MASEEKTTNRGEDFDWLEEERKPEAETTPEKKARLRVKYNGEDRDLDDDEAVTYAQKGLNYDKIKSRLDELEGQGAGDALEVEQLLADAQGMSRSDYRKQARDFLTKSQMDAELKKIKEESPDISDRLAKELAERRLAERTKAAQDRRAEEEQGPWNELIEEYPDIKTVDDLPEDVRESVQQGKKPVDAMRKSEIARLKKELEDLKAGKAAEAKNAENRAAALGSVQGNRGDAEKDEISKILFPGV